MGCSTKGWEYRLLVRSNDIEELSEEDTFAADDSENRQEFPATFGVTEIQDHIFIPGTRGTRAAYADQTTKGNRQAGGPMRLRMHRQNLDRWLPRILGAAEATDVFKVANTLPVFTMLVDKGQGKYYLYRKCKVARATFSGVTGGIVNVDLDVIAEREEAYPNSWPTSVAYTASLATRPLRFAEGSFFFDPAGTPVEVKFEQFSLTIDNLLEPKFYAGADYLTCLDEGRRVVTLSLPAAYTSAIKDYVSKGFDGIAGQLKWTADNMNTQVDMPCLLWANRTNTMEGDGDTLMPLQMRAYRSEAGDSGADDDIKITNDPNFSA